MAIASASAAHNRVEPTTSDNKNATVPDGTRSDSADTATTYATTAPTAVGLPPRAEGRQEPRSEMG